MLATIEDYETVYRLVNKMYEATTLGASEAVRETVKKVEQLKVTGHKVNYSVLGKELGDHRETVRRRVGIALKKGWLVNEETRKNHTADLNIGEPMPEYVGLPTADALELDMLSKRRLIPLRTHMATKGIPQTTACLKGELRR